MAHPGLDRRRWCTLWKRRRRGTKQSSCRRRRLRARQLTGRAKIAPPAEQGAGEVRTVTGEAQLALWRVRFAARDAAARAPECLESRLDLRPARRCGVNHWERGQRQDDNRARGGRLRSDRVSKEQPAPGDQRRTKRARLWLSGMAKEGRQARVANHDPHACMLGIIELPILSS